MPDPAQGPERLRTLRITLRGLGRGDKPEVGLEVAGAHVGIAARAAELDTRGSPKASLFPTAPWHCETWTRDRPPAVAATSSIGWVAVADW